MVHLLLLLQLAAIIAVNVQLRKIIMNQEEFRQQLSALVDQLVKAFNEIVNEIQVGQPVPQATVDKLVAAQAIAQQLDDLNPDPPQPNP